MKRFYVDTSVWLDYAFDRKNHIRPLGELAFQFFKKCKKNKWKVLYSNLVLEELRRELSDEEIKERCFKLLSEANLLLKVKSSPAQAKEALGIAQKHAIPGPDALHAVLARDNKAAIVSRDVHFEELYKIVSAYLPEEV